MAAVSLLFLLNIENLTKDILTFSKDIVINNETGKINNVKQITEKETTLYYSDLFIIEECIKGFVSNNYSNNIKEVIDTLNSSKTTCFEIINNQLIAGVTSSFISDFNTLNFSNYKTFQSAKEFNSFIKRITPLKRVYDNLGNAFLEDDIKKIFSQGFNNMLNQFKESVIKKGIIDKDDQLKQFRNEMNYLKKVFKLFSVIDSTKYKDIVDELIIKVNPNKLPKKKKKAKQEKEEKEDENAD